MHELLLLDKVFIWISAGGDCTTDLVQDLASDVKDGTVYVIKELLPRL